MLSDDKLVELFEAVGEIKEITKSANEKLDTFAKAQTDHTARIESIENEMKFYKRTVKWVVTLFIGASGFATAWASIKEKVGSIFGHHG